ncbi:MAG: cytochrome c oxidase subunit 3 [Alphaproteobacteria bacterium]
MADSHAKAHDYHLVDPSPWPLLGSVAAFVLAIGAIANFKDWSFSWLMYVGFAMVFYVMFAWWRDVIREAKDEGFHTPVVQLHHRYGMILFIASEVMFFVAWFWAFFDASLFPKEQIGGVWPPVGIETFDPWHLPLINTMILLLSGTTVTAAHHYLIEGKNDLTVKWLIATVLLGALFTCFQVYEYGHAAFSFSGHIYGATFFMATGFHGFHVLVGTIFLFVNLVRAARGSFTADHHFGFEAAAWYWHFVDVVWLFLFAAVYIWAG